MCVCVCVCVCVCTLVCTLAITGEPHILLRSDIAVRGRVGLFDPVADGKIYLFGLLRVHMLLGVLQTSDVSVCGRVVKRSHCQWWKL